jgi:hypothetical protein
MAVKISNRVRRTNNRQIIPYIEFGQPQGGGGTQITANTVIPGLSTTTIGGIVNALQDKMDTPVYDPDRNQQVNTRNVEVLRFTQATPAAEWVWNHNLNRYPKPVVRNQAGQELECGLFHNSNNVLTLSFSPPQAGSAEID